MSSSEDSSLSPSVSKRAKFNSGNENGDGDNEADIAIPSEDVANHANESDNLPQKETSVSSDPALNDSTKKVKIPIVGNTLFTDYGDEQISKIQQEWETTENISDEAINIFKSPFRHGEIKDFVKNIEFVQAFTDLFSTIEFHEKASDLFQFNQSDDLNSLVDPQIFVLNEYLTTKVVPALKKITGLPLNDTIDMFLSIYNQTDFLLCHDDELDSRRIAFIWYLSEEWSEEYGGTLDLYSATDSCHPEQVVKRITPEFNKFVFFEVGATSFHQVSEVLKEGKRRLALSGWIYGDALARPSIQFPVEKSFNVLESAQNNDGVLKKLCADMYHNSEIYAEINEQLAEQSEVLIPGFLRDEVYAALCKTIVEADVSNSTFNLRGPSNMAHYKETLLGPPKPAEDDNAGSDSTGLESLRELFYSAEFLSFMEKITEFPFTSSTENKIVSSLQKFSHGCYSLLKTGGAKQTGTKPVADKDLNEEEEEPNLVDVIYYFANNWNEERGGNLIYSTTEGEQLITVPPEGNCLAVVVRSPIVNSYTNYVNCLAKEDVFFVYKMTFAFDGSI